MDEIFSQVLTGVAGSGPFAALALYIIWLQNKQLVSKDERINSLTDTMMAAAKANTQALTELRADVLR